MFPEVLFATVLTLVSSLTVPVIAHAESEQCRAICDNYRSCAEDALRTINHGSCDARTCRSYPE